MARKSKEIPRRGKQLPIAVEAARGAETAAYPGFIEPALATLRTSPPSGEKWIHELKLDGYRAQAHLSDHEAQIFTRRGNDWSTRFRSIAEEIGQLAAHVAILDGEVVAIDETGRVNFGTLQTDLGSGRMDRLVYYAFDLLYLEGYDLRRVPQIERKRLLKDLLDRTPRQRVFYSEHFEIEGSQIFHQVCDLGMEGIVSKLREGPYQSGRSDYWLKTKCSKREKLPIIGFRAEGSAISSLYVGRWTDNELRLAGKVGTGFSFKTAPMVRDILMTVVTDKPPIPGLKKPKVIWVRPEYEAEVEYTEVTSDGLMRHGSFKGIEPAPERPLPAAPAQTKVKSENIMRLLPDAVAPPAEELKAYWKKVSRKALKYFGGRPLTLVRRAGGKIFFHKGPLPRIPKDVHSITLEKREGGEGTRVWVDSLAGLYGLVDMGVVEVHAWNAMAEDFEHADLFVFDLDPGQGIEWSFVTDTALSLRDFLRDKGFDPWVKTSGGKGFHLMVPLEKKLDHDAARELSKRLAVEFAHRDARYITTSDPHARQGHIFLDYLRNGRGATAVAAYSPRAREGFPVSMPVSWAQVEKGVRADAFTIEDF